MTPEEQQQFNAELQMVIAVAAQIYPATPEPVAEAIRMIRLAEAKLKEFYEPETPATQAQPEPPVQAALPPRPSRETVNRSISAHSKVIVEKKLKSTEELQALVRAYGVERKESLSDPQAEELLKKLQDICK